MSPFLKGRKKKEVVTEKVEERVEQKVEETPGEKVAYEQLTPATWFEKLTDLADVQRALPSLPDLDIQLNIGDSLLRYVKKGLDKPTLTEERSLRPDVTIRISTKAWNELAKIRNIDEFGNLYRKYAKNPSHEEFVKVSISNERLVSDSGILRSKLFKYLLLI